MSGHGTSVADERAFSMMSFMAEQRPRDSTYMTNVELVLVYADQRLFTLSTLPLREVRSLFLSRIILGNQRILTVAYLCRYKQTQRL
jgi:hypothetical protein